jgi:NTE family protein
MPFGAVCLDIERAQEVLLRGGGLRRAAAASSAIPGILPPVQVNGRVLVDGGWADKIPVLPAFLMGADVVIAVDITAALDGAEDFRRGADITMRANAIKDSALVAFQRGMADLTIRPDVSKVHWADFSDYERCIEAGDEAATERIPEIRKLLKRERLLSVLRRGRGRRLAQMNLDSGQFDVAVEE